MGAAGALRKRRGLESLLKRNLRTWLDEPYVDVICVEPGQGIIEAAQQIAAACSAHPRALSGTSNRAPPDECDAVSADTRQSL